MDNPERPNIGEQTPTHDLEVTTQNTWPGAFGIYKTSRKAVMVNLIPIIELVLINVVVGSVLRFLPTNGFKVFGNIVSIFLGIFINICLIKLYLAGLNGRVMAFNEVVEQCEKFYVSALGLYALIILTCLSFLLLIIPGLTIVPRVVLAPYFLIDKKLNAVDAYKASWHTTKGNVSKVYGIVGVTILMILPVITIIGIIATIYLLVMYSAAFAILYQFVSKKKEA
jgi:uncharacterized membrane protein